MSWSWEREEEKKEYDVKGTVTISTEEYRDLIQRVAELKAAGQREHDDWYSEYQKCSKLEESLKKLEKAWAELTEWMDSDDALRTKYKLWKVERMEEANKEDE